MSANGQIDRRNTCAPVAQLDRVPPSEGGGRGFESRLVRHISLFYKLFYKAQADSNLVLAHSCTNLPMSAVRRDEHCPGHRFWLYFGLCQFCAYTVPHPLTECHPLPPARALAHRATHIRSKQPRCTQPNSEAQPLPHKRSSRSRPWKTQQVIRQLNII